MSVTQGCLLCPALCNSLVRCHSSLSCSFRKEHVRGHTGFCVPRSAAPRAPSLDPSSQCFWAIPHTPRTRRAHSLARWLSLCLFSHESQHIKRKAARVGRGGIPGVWTPDPGFRLKMRSADNHRSVASYHGHVLPAHIPEERRESSSRTDTRYHRHSPRCNCCSVPLTRWACVRVWMEGWPHRGGHITQQTHTHHTPHQAPVWVSLTGSRSGPEHPLFSCPAAAGG